MTCSLLTARWRTGRKLGRTVYVQLGPEPSDEDPIIGMFDSRELAEHAVHDHNQSCPWSRASLQPRPTNDHDKAMRIAHEVMASQPKPPLTAREAELLARDLIEAERRNIGSAASFAEAWSRMEAKGYRYGGDALGNVQLGWELRDGTVVALRAKLVATVAQHDGMQKALYKMLEDARAELAAAQAERDEARADRDAARREREQLRSLLAQDHDSLSAYLAMQTAQRLTAERDALQREADRLRHGVPIEGDFVCPDSLALVEARREIERWRPVIEAAKAWRADDVGGDHGRDLFIPSVGSGDVLRDALDTLAAKERDEGLK